MASVQGRGYLVPILRGDQVPILGWWAKGEWTLRDAFSRLLLGSLPRADAGTKRPQQRTHGTDLGCSSLGKSSVGRVWKHLGWHTKG